MHRFYIPKSNLNLQNVVLNGKEEIHHLKNVLRLKEREHVELFNDQGETAVAEIISIAATAVDFHILSMKKSENPKPLIILACAIPKKSKFETIIEKSTELGVDKIIPLVTKRTEIKIIEERQEKKQIRYQTIALNAAKQSKRPNVPEIKLAASLEDVLKEYSPTSTILIPSLQKPRQKIRDALQNIKTPEQILILIGPEGDFTQEEYLSAAQKKAVAVSLGETILKVETAAILTVGFTALFYRAG